MTGMDPRSVRMRGGSFSLIFDNSLLASSRYSHYPDGDWNIGFRVASSEAVVPEPSTLLVWSGLGAMGLVMARRRRTGGTPPQSLRWAGLLCVD